MTSQQLVQDHFEGATKGWAREIIHHRVEDAIEVSETHRCVEGQVGLFKIFALIIPYLKDPHSDTRYRAGKETDNKDHRHSHHELNGPLDFPPFVHSPASQLPGDSDCAEGDDYSGQEELGDIESIVPGGEGAEAQADVETLTLCAVAVVEKVFIGKKVTSRKKYQTPEAERDPESIAQAHLVDLIQWVDDLEVSINCHGREEEDPRCPVGCQQKEQDTTQDVAIQPVFATPVVVCSEWQAEQHNGVSDSQVSQIHRVGLPGVHVKDEHPQCDKVPHQSKHELQDQNWRQNPVQGGSLEGAALVLDRNIHC